MDNPIQNKAEMTKLNYERSSRSIECAEMNEGTSLSLEHPDTMLTIIVLLLACAALTVLAHVIV